MLVSTHGYGILWDNSAWTHFNPTDTDIALQPAANPAITDGTGIVLTDCKDSDIELWHFDEKTGLLSLTGSTPTSCVDSNDGAVGTTAHMWHCDPAFVYNQVSTVP